MHIEKLIAAAEHTVKSNPRNESFREDHFDKLQADYAERMKKPDSPRCVGCGE